MIRLFIICGFYLLSVTLFAQKFDFQWLYGTFKVNGDNTEISNILIDFNEQPAQLNEVNDVDVQFYFQRTAIADKNGDLAFMSDGCRVYDRFGNIMANGDTLNPGGVFDIYCDEVAGWDTSPGGRQSMFALPQPGNDSIWYLFHISYAIDPDITTQFLYYSIINTNRNNGLGEVIEKNVILDNLPEFGKMNVAYSADLSSWFIVSAEWESDRYDVFILDSVGVIFHQQQSIGEVTPDGSGAGYSTRFSPDGTVYAVYNHLTGLEVFDFDRVTGSLSNARFVPETRNQDSLDWGGLEFSPSGRYLYLASGHFLDQFDLEAPTLEEGRVRVANMEALEGEFFQPIFAQLQLGPDCRLYNFMLSGRYVHIIHRPDEAGTACMVEQRAWETPSHYFRGAPLYPKYRMRALGDTSSICDHVTATIFTSLQETEEESPVQAYLYPNPAITETRVVLETKVRELRYELYDFQGRRVLEGRRDKLPAGVALRLDLRGLAKGTYVLRLTDARGRRWSERVMKQ
ncbi:hypothetical protein CEQ90_12265 [Lewinellaceae bacterium SD302]|nr:hypothetical protein CEQ90_12265 [Lewinellaceae bacterium SD302]